jgi:hypothetical protein
MSSQGLYGCDRQKRGGVCWGLVVARAVWCADA